ncbi:hypothetical protein ACMFMG_002872 [Clarireedia jacksonii]
MFNVRNLIAGADVTAPPSTSSQTIEQEDTGWPTQETDPASNKKETPTAIPAQAIRPLGTLHLTLGVMSLMGEERVQAAVEFLKGLDFSSLISKSSNEEIIAPGKKADLTFSLRGLHAMHNPTSTSVLYAAPSSSSGALMRFCENLRETFTAAGFVLPEARGLVLHATVVNTVYVKGGKGGRDRRGGGERGGERGKRKGKITFDATAVLERYRNFEWLREGRVEKVAICRMGAKKMIGEGGEEDEAYEVEEEVEVGV